VKIPEDAIIPEEKLTRYLLAPRDYDDKSGFLARAGFTRANPDVLMNAIRQQAGSAEAVEDGRNAYGIFYRVEAPLVGPLDRLEVVTIWLRWHVDGTIHFVTLKPYRGGRRQR
jgi:hypothetical protein